MPDADIDFADRDRYKVIDYVIEKYGRKAVCQIINFGRMKAKMVVKDVARAMGIPVVEANLLSAMVNEKSLTPLTHRIDEVDTLTPLEVFSRNDPFPYLTLVKQPGPKRTGQQATRHRRRDQFTLKLDNDVSDAGFGNLAPFIPQ